MTKERILVIDDEAGIRSSVQGILEDEGYQVATTETGEDGLKQLEKEGFDLILLDIWLPEMNGIEVLKKIKTREKNLPVLMISGHGSVESAVQATKPGAYDYLEKPLSLEKVILTVKYALKQSRLEEENILLKEKVRAANTLVGKDKSIKKIKEAIATAAPSNGRVLITGENGTGKELVARLIHWESPRKPKRFIQLNCGAIPENLIENELFGYQGDDTVESTRKKGKLLLADGGVLFLDEVSEIHPSVQARLVKVLTEQKLDPLDSGKPISFDTRVIAASDKDVKKLVEQGRFREDLYYKLNVIPIHIPPLRERKDDIPLLINYYLDYFAMEDGKKKKSMSDSVIQAFVNYSWPGNVSELINVIERFVIMVKEDEIRDSHLSLLVEPIESQYISGIKPKKTLVKAREQFEKKYIHHTLLKHNWEIGATAAELELEEAELQEKIKFLGITFLG